jgi:hypothetical protein
MWGKAPNQNIPFCATYPCLLLHGQIIHRDGGGGDPYRSGHLPKHVFCIRPISRTGIPTPRVIILPDQTRVGRWRIMWGYVGGMKAVTDVIEGKNGGIRA